MSEQNNMHERVAGLKTAIEVVNELVDNFYHVHPDFHRHRNNFDEGYVNALNVISSTLELELDSCLEEPEAFLLSPPNTTTYDFDVDKILSLEDIRELFRLWEIQIHDDGTDKFKPVRHLYQAPYVPSPGSSEH